MKNQLLVGLIALGFAATGSADIQDPPGNDYGPTRKLGRGIGNFLFASTELPHSICEMNKSEGNSGAASYGVVRGLGRSTARHFTGLAEIFTFAAPTHHGSFRPMLPNDIPWIHGGYSEFPPELGFESKHTYCRDY
ncbi:MAG TPA: exosortase system-associated protein, TIGR04073 family [Chthoniobacterales bacterium]|jgi:putative exosortase-associated protein (TIGR04073 family)|nr:exosortase system-associated protein, TIGR04073 family [Chthoniobacterales bacterium]